MAMDDWFDGLAKESRHLSRRQVFGAIAGGLGAVILGAFGVRKRNANECGKLCAECCHNQFPHGGRELAECITSCHNGEGLCGPIVCPQ
jgi:hypothetical protein